MNISIKISALVAALALSACGVPGEETSSSVKDLAHTDCGYGATERNDGRLLAMEQEIVRQVNVVRASNGLPALQQHYCISSVAYFHSVNMAKQARAEHVLDGLDAGGRLNAAGVTHNWWGENIHNAWSTRNGQPYFDYDNEVASAMGFWLNSPGHRANILNSHYTHIGVGLSMKQIGNAGYFYATQVFMSE